MQIEMEKACIKHLKEANAHVRPSSRTVDSGREAFESEASVIIPVRNRIRTIRDAVSSALSRQTAFPFNVTVIGNRSTDGITEALQGFSTDNRPMHIISQESNLSIGGCWNVGVHHEKYGKFAVQLDSDDPYRDGHTLQKIVGIFYQQNCVMMIGAYLVTDLQMDEIVLSVIDHKEWTVEDGLSSASCTNGLDVPWIFYTPIPRKIKFPNTSYGEDYAISLSISCEYTIGRIYDVIYLCRRWEGNSDTTLDIERINRNNFYKGSTRTRELQVRIRMHSIDESFQCLVNETTEKQEKDWKLAKKSYKELKQGLKKEKTLEFKLGGDAKRVRFFPNL